ncbi:MAG: proton-conducting transporter membrane subunit, partial [Chthoniobacterales bacterium]
MNSAPWIILFAPLVAAAGIAIATQPFKKLSSYLSVAAVAVSFVFSLVVFASPNQDASFNWIDLGIFQVRLGYLIDDFSRMMLLVVSGVGLLIHVYSIGYMHDDRGRSRYFAGLSLFMFSMLGIVLANNFIMMFIFWELVGVSSYILIGHWFDRPSAADAANKALIVNRIGDFGFMLGILMVWSASGTVMFGEMSSKWTTLGLGTVYATAAALLIFCGAVGKSAQFPLHVWLPDAMEGPTPVSALIHAATMVAAGVYMLARVYFLFAG